MQYFDDDMGELFRTASADIRLRAAEDDWDKIQKGLLPDLSALPATAFMPVSRKTDRLLKFTLFILVMTVITTPVVLNQRTKKMEAELQPAIRQAAVSSNRSAIENEQTGQKTKPNFILRSRTPVIAENQLAGEHFTMKSLNGLAPFAREERIQVEVEAETEPSMGINESKIDTMNLKTKSNQSGDHNKPNSERGIYGGFIAGPQYSQTKQQRFGNAGLSGGLIAGFHFNKKGSVETGLIISDKQYSSSGKYFDMSKISSSMPSGMKLIQIRSKTTVLEIPLEIRYNLAAMGKGNLFASGGFSSYIITREINQYQANVNGIDETLNGNYSTHQQYFAAAAKIAAGYEWKTGKGLNLRVEPYLQVPLKAMGMGSMQVMSAGVYLGITFPLIK
jgi:hypothetical protein